MDRLQCNSRSDLTQTLEKFGVDDPDDRILTAAQAYTLLLLLKGNDERRLEEIVAAIRKQVGVPQSCYPFVIAEGLSLTDAMAFQMAIACADSISAFVRDELVAAATVEVFRELLANIVRSPEFAPVRIKLRQMPDTEDSRFFQWLFFGSIDLLVPATFVMFSKKARLLSIWAQRIGAKIDVMY